MRTFVTALLLLIASVALGEDRYSFHIKATDGRTALLANPQFADLKLTPEQVARAANDRVILLDHTAGTHWTWRMLSWRKDQEQTLNASAKPGDAADLGLRPNDDGTVRTRCLRRACAIRITTANGRQFDATLKSGETKDLPLDAQLDVAVTR